MTTNEIIRLENIRRNFIVGSETVHALRGVNFTINSGEFVTIMGTSGSGKSTLLNILGCLDTPTSGEYYLDGISVRSMGKNERSILRNRKIGFVFQSYNLLPKTTALETWNYPSCTTPPSRPKKGTNWHRKLLMPLDCPSAKIINPTKCREGNNSG